MVVEQAVKYVAGCMLGYIPGVEMYHLTHQATYSCNVIIAYMVTRYRVLLLFIWIIMLHVP